MAVWNQLVFTRDCVNSILKNTDMDYRLIIIDNASDDAARRYLEGLAQAYSQIKLIRNDKNLGFIKAVNKGMAVSDAPYVCLLNNDTLVTKDWLRIMIELAESRKDIGIVNPSSNTLGQRPASGEPIDLFSRKLIALAKDYVELGAAVGFCMLIKRAVIDRIGLFDEIYGMGNFEDTDFSRRAVKEGYLAVRACGAYVYHRENQSFNMLKTFQDDFKRNREIFEFRWGRPKRVAYILDNYDENIIKRLNQEAAKLARGGNWVSYIVKDQIELPPHSNIHLVAIDGKWFYPKAIWAVLKKKKKFDEIFVSGEREAAILKNLDFIHKARIGCY